MKCLVVDDHPIVGAAVKSTIGQLPYISAVDSEPCAEKALQLATSQHYDLLVLDVDLGDSNGFDFLTRIRARGYRGKVLFLSADKNAIHADTAMKLNANGFVYKSESLETLGGAIESILQGYSYFKFPHKDQQRQLGKPLSTREKMVLDYLIQGKGNADIAEVLSLSAKTVSTYKARILKKYNANNIVELITMLK
ncbi:response regulator [Vibrio maritimus]|uniref:response regulator transcription factor n=1 Tax=Vibrio TaxID=662 RepID=UPI002074F0CA|nr:response regulator transcription factor [Vibrio sp. SCSIO 43140]